MVESTLRWWAWQLGRRPEAGESGLSLVPVRVVDAPLSAAEDPTGRPSWVLRTARGDLYGYTERDVLAVVAALTKGAP